MKHLLSLDIQEKDKLKYCTLHMNKKTYTYKCPSIDEAFTIAENIMNGMDYKFYDVIEKEKF